MNLHRPLARRLVSWCVSIITLLALARPTTAQPDAAQANAQTDVPATAGASGAPEADAPAEITLATPAKLRVEAARQRALSGALADRLDGRRDRLAELKGSAKVLDAQASSRDVRRDARRGLRIDLLRNLAHQSLHRATDALLRAEIDQIEARAHTTDARIKDVTAAELKLAEEQNQRALEEAKQREEEGERKLQDQAKKQEAEADLEGARMREAQETNAQIKSVLTSQRELAERVVELTEERPEVETKLTEALAREREAFAMRRDELKVFLDQLPVELPPTQRREEVDPVFVEVRRERRETRRAYLRLTDDLEDLKTQWHKEEAGAEAARERFAAIEADQRGGGVTELGKARVDLAQAQVKVESLEALIAKQRYDIALERRTLLEEQLEFFEEEIELLLPLISEEAKQAFYSITRDENWADARMALELAAIRITRHIAGRLSAFVSVLADPLSISLWAWIGGLVWRILLVMTALFVARSRGQSWVRRMTDVALKRSVFKRRPTVAIKIGEIIRHVLPPLALFLSLTYIVSYVRGVLPEARYMQWVINAIVIFRVTTITVSVLVLPRTVREPKKLIRREADVTENAEGVDVFGLEIERARKLVRSAKVIIWFWLIVIYVPGTVVALLGHSIVWRLVDIASTWGFILVMYSVLSTWRDDIAALFERIAPERLERAVAFVNDNKDRIWGVLVIAGASIYVIGREGMRLGRTYLLDTEWSKRLSNFIFRKRVEYQSRDKESLADPDDFHEALTPAELPPQYLEVFHDHPLTDEVYLIERAEAMAERIASQYSGWCDVPRQGSVALVGETGVGKSTTLYHAARKLEEIAESRGARLVHMKLREKMTSSKQVRTLMQEIFDLEGPFETKHDLIEAIRAQPEHIVVLDDCHNLFLRLIGGFEGLELFLEIVNLTDSDHFWSLSLNKYTWAYLTRVRRRDHYFGAILEIEPWTEAEIQDLIWKRNLMTGYTVNFNDLVVTRDEGEDISYEVIKSATGYFRLLHEFCQGNPRVALTYWLRSLRSADEEDTMHVGLFRPPPKRVTQVLADNYWFTLTALAQHVALDAAEISGVINADVGFCDMALNYFEGMEVVEIRPDGRAYLGSLYLRQVLKYLTDSNYLYE